MKKLLLSLLVAGVSTSLSEAVIIAMTTLPTQGGAVVAGTFTLAGAPSGTNDGGNHWPAAESPDKVGDGLASTKYLNFAELNTGVILGPVLAGQIVRRITFTAANDSPNRDPLTFSLYGSATPITGNVAIASLTPIVTGAVTGLAVDPGRLTAGPTQTFANAAAFNGYLLIFPTVRDAATANSMQIAEIRFETIPEPATALLGALGALGFAARRRRA